MKEITLEMVDKVKERTGVTYKQAKEALEICDGDVLEAIIYIESNVVFANENIKDSYEDTNTESIEEFKIWIKNLIEKGNVTRIKIRKDDKVLVDVPVNAGIAAAIIGIIIPPILAFSVIAVVATKITIEITKKDGSVEVINKYVAKAAEEVKEKASDIASMVKEKINDVKGDNSVKKEYKNSQNSDDETIYTYTVDFEEEKREK